jgi:hypothetical protein
MVDGILKQRKKNIVMANQINGLLKKIIYISNTQLDFYIFAEDK